MNTPAPRSLTELQQRAEKAGVRLVCVNGLAPEKVAQARLEGRMYHDGRGSGYVLPKESDK